MFQGYMFRGQFIDTRSMAVWSLRNSSLQTPPGPEGSNGSSMTVCRGAAEPPPNLCNVFLRFSKQSYCPHFLYIIDLLFFIQN